MVQDAGMLAALFERSMGLDETWEYFFPGEGGAGCLARGWITRWFSELWSRVSDERATPYMLRHNYAVENINNLVSGGMEWRRWRSAASCGTGCQLALPTTRSSSSCTPRGRATATSGRAPSIGGSPSTTRAKSSADFI